MPLHWVDYFAEFARFRSNSMRADNGTKIVGALGHRPFGIGGVAVI